MRELRRRPVGRLRIFSVVLLSAGAIAAPPCLGHDTWLSPLQKPSPQDHLLLELTSGQAFPQLDYAIKPERIQKLGCTTVTGACKLTVGQRGPQALQIQSSIKAAKPVLAWVQLKPKVLELTPDKIAEYFEEIDATPELRESWRKRPEPKRWRESYVKCAKALAHENHKLWSTVTGLALELVPLNDPTGPGATDLWAVQVLRDGQPAAEIAVGLTSASSPERAATTEFQRSNAQGLVHFKKPTAGLWLLRATDLRPASEDQLEWRSLFTTLTFEVPA